MNIITNIAIIVLFLSVLSIIDTSLEWWNEKKYRKYRESLKKTGKKD
jgi:hypothetical protein